MSAHSRRRIAAIVPHAFSEAAATTGTTDLQRTLSRDQFVEDLSSSASGVDDEASVGRQAAARQKLRILAGEEEHHRSDVFFR